MSLGKIMFSSVNSICGQMLTHHSREDVEKFIRSSWLQIWINETHQFSYIFIILDLRVWFKCEVTCFFSSLMYPTSRNCLNFAASLEFGSYSFGLRTSSILLKNLNKQFWKLKIKRTWFKNIWVFRFARQSSTLF